MVISNRTGGMEFPTAFPTKCPENAFRQRPQKGILVPRTKFVSEKEAEYYRWKIQTLKLRKR
jgi:hypothetical protein